MVRTLIYLEGFVAAALATLLPFMARDLALAVTLPLSFVLLVPLCASLAVRPLPNLRDALVAAFSEKPPTQDSREIQSMLGELGGYLGRAMVLGFLATLVVALPRVATSGNFREGLSLSAWLVLYGTLGILAMRILALATARLALAPPTTDEGKPARLEAFRGQYGVSEREWEVASCIASGASYKEAADRLFISLSTVKAHLSSVYRKTGTRDKIELVLLIRREGC